MTRIRKLYELGLKQYLENFQCGFFKLENDQIIYLLFYYFTKLAIGTYFQEIWTKINAYPNGNVKVEKIILRKVDY